MKEFFVPAVVTPDPTANATDLLVERVRLTPNDALFSLPTADGGWSDVTSAEFLSQVTALAKGFMAAGVQSGDKIGFMCKTRYEWTLVDFATWFAGAVLVPIYETSSPNQIQYILDDSEATHMIVETAEHFARYDEVAGDLSGVTHVWQMHLGDLEKLSGSGSAVSDDELEARRSQAWRGEDILHGRRADPRRGRRGVRQAGRHAAEHLRHDGKLLASIHPSARQPRCLTPSYPCSRTGCSGP